MDAQQNNLWPTREDAETHPLKAPPFVERAREQQAEREAKKLAEPPVYTWHDVVRVSYHYHRSRANPDGPPTMRVEYHLPEGERPRIRKEWVCLEHDAKGFAGRNARAWWAKRSREDMPESVDMAVDMANAGCLAEPSRIQIRVKEGDDFPRITSAELGARPEPLDSDWLHATREKYLNPEPEIEDEFDVPF